MGGLDNSFLAAAQWRVGLEYRFLTADRFYVGHDYSPNKIPTAHHMPVRYRISTLATHVEYGFTNRLSVGLIVAGSTGTESREEDDGSRHSQYATGLGDAAVVGNAWLLEPQDHGSGNVRLGLGVKAPTGDYRATGNFFTQTGVERRPVDPAIQPGDGGWGAVMQIEAFRAIRSRVSAYAAGSYLLNPQLHTDVPFHVPSTTATVPVSVADEYSAHAGLSYAVWPARQITLSLGGRVDGVPVRDLLGYSDTSFRRPGYVIYAEPAVAYTFSRSPLSPGGHTFTLSVPIALDQNRKASMFDVALGRHGGGDFARFLVFLGYSTRW